MATAHPVITREQRQQINVAIQHGYKPSNVSFAGFSVTDIRNYMFGVNSGKVGLAEAESVIRAATGMKQTKITMLAGALIDKKRLKPGATSYDQGYGDITWGLHHLAEHPAGSHYHGDFSISTFINATVGVFTLGTMPNITSFLSGLGSGKFDLGKIQWNVPFSGAQVNDLSHDIVDLYTGQQLSKQAAPILDSQIARYADTVIGAGAGIITGSAAYSWGSLASAAPGAAAGGESAALIGVTESSLAVKNAPAVFEIGEAANYTKAGVTAASLESVTGGSTLFGTVGGLAADAAKFIGGTISAAYVTKLISGGGKALQDVLHGNFEKAGSDLVDALNPVGSGGTGQKPVQAGGGYGGGGGGGGFYGGGVAQSSLLSTLLPIGLIALIVLVFVYLYKRKR